MAIGKAKNAGLLAIRMLAMENEKLSKKLKAYHQKMADDSLKKTDNLL
ncbi:MAG: AIR carboxylase family protein [Gracilimonas sp.]|nr:AIR carboxylase family protein [Gracilimonas sp.]